MGKIVRVPGDKSPPARGRGLKLSSALSLKGVLWSPPARGRGLKLAALICQDHESMSPPARGRGLKLLDHALKI